MEQDVRRLRERGQLDGDRDSAACGDSRADRKRPSDARRRSPPSLGAPHEPRPPRERFAFRRENADRARAESAAPGSAEASYLRGCLALERRDGREAVKRFDAALSAMRRRRILAICTRRWSRRRTWTRAVGRGSRAWSQRRRAQPSWGSSPGRWPFKAGTKTRCASPTPPSPWIPATSSRSPLERSCTFAPRALQPSRHRSAGARRLDCVREHRHSPSRARPRDVPPGRHRAPELRARSSLAFVPWGRPHASGRRALLQLAVFTAAAVEKTLALVASGPALGLAHGRTSRTPGSIALAPSFGGSVPPHSSLSEKALPASCILRARSDLRCPAPSHRSGLARRRPAPNQRPWSKTQSKSGRCRGIRGSAGLLRPFRRRRRTPRAPLDSGAATPPRSAHSCPSMR